ncbi:D-glycerate dehydrogenase [Staphylococcus equorum]|uniref:2-hydroxyacid dehydrogenase n=1 Tax=Staphylococcus TaxID=1279 RepID=UPI000397A8BE|nr:MULTISPECIES: D-glycerate dehydrogenase [Staphylococcus]ANK37867.1 putative 2-hydroxyacid dehydrogenase [Staphylococcus sp. AntiMn-1]ANR67651.1 D-glycerate dehydrogenase [Staphylococcus equorum]ERH34216.1 2-ketogluconate reductase [Staphylococcus equorum UMC-CNS-924]MCE5006831.1 D-glycerate dehydrogenase [Staphylococcus equorum]MCZ4236225.1 D-glycerate dehydrogenase [Staphylococcus equorum]
MNKIVVSRKIPKSFIEQLETLADVEVWNESYTPMPRDKFLASLNDATACLITLSEKIDEEVIEAAPHLKVIANMAVGFDNIDVQLVQSKGIVVTNTPGVLTETTAELGFTLMLTVARRIVEAEQYVQRGEWQSWGPYLLAGKDLYNAKVGIYGMGDIGKAFARRLKGFNANIMYHNRSRHKDAEEALGALYVPFDTMLEHSDFIICTAPLTEDTRNKFDTAAFKKMKNDAIFINIGRGAVVDEQALVNALQDGEIGACGLDVLRQEPIDMTHPLLSMKNAVILPHIGSASVVTRNRMIQLCVDNIRLVLSHKQAKTPIS